MILIHLVGNDLTAYATDGPHQVVYYFEPGDDAVTIGWTASECHDLREAPAGVLSAVIESLVSNKKEVTDGSGSET